MINTAVRDRLIRQHGIAAHPWPTGGGLPRRSVPATCDLFVQHYWPGMAAHEPPPPGVAHYVVTQPWEAGTPPAAWAATWQHPAFRQLWTPSAHSERLFLEAFPELQGKTRVIHNGVDVQTFTPEGKRWPCKPGTESHFKVLFVGGLLPRKGIHELYTAWRQAFTSEEPVRLYLKSQGGQTFYRGQTIPPPVDLAATIRVIDGDDYSAEAMAALYRSCAVVCQPYRSEGWCLPLLEAMACGVPVLAPEYGPAPEFVPPEAGLSVPMAAGHVTAQVGVDLAALAKALRWCFLHREQLPAMGAAGRQAALAYSWDNVAQRYSAAIKEVCRWRSPS